MQRQGGQTLSWSFRAPEEGGGGAQGLGPLTALQHCTHWHNLGDEGSRCPERRSAGAMLVPITVCWGPLLKGWKPPLYLGVAIAAPPGFVCVCTPVRPRPPAWVSVTATGCCLRGGPWCITQVGNCWGWWLSPARDELQVCTPSVQSSHSGKSAVQGQPGASSASHPPVPGVCLKVVTSAEGSDPLSLASLNHQRICTRPAQLLPLASWLPFFRV